MATIYYIRVFCVYVCMYAYVRTDVCVHICVRVGISAHIYVRMFSVSKDAFVSCVVYERLWIRMYVFWYKMKSRHALCTGKIDRGREREKRNESKREKRDKRKRDGKTESEKERMGETKVG